MNVVAVLRLLLALVALRFLFRFVGAIVRGYREADAKAAPRERELVRDRVTKERATTERDTIVNECFARGLLVLGAGKNAIRISPPLVLNKAQASTAVEILDQALSQL